MDEQKADSSGAAPSAVAAPVKTASGTLRDAASASLAQFIIGHPLRVLLLLAVQVALAAWWAHELQNEKGMAAVVPKSPNSLLRDFPESSEKIRDVMVFWCSRPGCDITRLPQFSIERRAVQGLLDTLRARHRFCNDLGWSSMEASSSGPSGFMGMKFPYVSQDRTTSFVEYHTSRRECMRDVRRKLQRGFQRSSGPLLMSLGGPESVAGASMDAELRSMMRHAYIAVPVSCLLLWLFVGNFFRVLTPVACMVVAYISGQAAVGVVKQFDQSLNVQYDDSFVLFIDLALSVDYALFFWTRFVVERAGHEYMEALKRSLETSGVVVLVSNFFVVVAWTCTLCFPNLNIWGFRALYIEALSGCALAGVWSLAFSASAAACLPTLFDNGDSMLSKAHDAFWALCPGPEVLWKPWARRITSKPLMLVLPLLAYACMVPFVVTLTKYQPSYDVQRQGVRRDTIESTALAQFERHFRLGMLSPVTLVVEAKEVPGPNVPEFSLPVTPQKAPVLVATGSQSPTMKGEAAEASGNDLGPEAQVLLKQLAAGSVETATADTNSLMQLQIGLRQAEEASGAVSPQAQQPRFVRAAGKAIRKLALNPEFGQFVCTIAEAIMNKTRGRQYEIQMADMLSIWWLPPQAGQTGCSVGTAKMVMHQQVNLEKNLLDYFPPVLQRSVSEDGQKVQLKLFTRFSPSSPEAVDFDQLLRNQLEASIGLNGSKLFDVGGRHYSLQVHHTSAIARQVEANREMAHAAPRIFGIFAALIALLITVTFRSAFLCFKLAMTVLCPIVATYGVTVAVYQLDALGFLHAELFSSTGGLDFRMIYVTPGVLFGLAMDYDLFLFARTFEYRMEGYDNTSAVRRALEETGPVITVAGVLMAISFFAIMLSNTMLFRTLGFVFFFGVTFDVFVIRTCIAPVFLCLAEQLNYWPRAMPKATKHWE